VLESQDRLRQREWRDCSGVKLIRNFVAAKDDYLRVACSEQSQSDPIRGGEDAKVIHHAGESFKRGLGSIFVSLIVGVAMQTQERDPGGGVSCRRRRVLQRLPSRAECAQQASGIDG